MHNVGWVQQVCRDTGLGNYKKHIPCLARCVLYITEKLIKHVCLCLEEAGIYLHRATPQIQQEAFYDHEQKKETAESCTTFTYMTKTELILHMTSGAQTAPFTEVKVRPLMADS